MKHLFTIRGKNLSFLTNKRSLLLTFIFLVLTLAVFIFSVGMGEISIHPLDVAKSLIGMGLPEHALVIQTFRLPRTLVSVLVGACFGVSGAILQGMVRNPLASPDLIGITGGASVAAIAFITLFPEASINWLPLAAILGATIATVIIYTLAWKKGVSALRLVLIGVGIQSCTAALTTLLLVMSPVYLTNKAMVWLTGSVYGTNWNDVSSLLPWTILFIGLAILSARHLNIQQLGDDIARGVGQRVEQQRFLLLSICVALAGAAVAIGGAIGFVALLAPQIARKLVGPSFGGLLPVAALTGSLIVVAADLVARTAFSPLDLPVGIFTSVIGAPFFMYLLYKYRNQ
jgi:iron complex transport system permease protein